MTKMLFWLQNWLLIVPGFNQLIAQLFSFYLCQNILKKFQVNPAWNVIKIDGKRYEVTLGFSLY